jgi:O-antigen ligase
VRKYLITLIIPLIALIILFVPIFSRDSQKVFRSEIDQGFKEGTLESKPFRGRLYYWQRAFRYFRRQPILVKIFGSGVTGMKVDNDYIRILVDNGIVGFLLYIVLLSGTLVLIGAQFFQTKNTIFLISGIALITLSLMSMGAHPSLIPNFQWFTWGTIGFAMGKTHNEKSPQSYNNH